MHNQIFKLILLLHGQDRQSKALDCGSHHELLELVERLILTKTLLSFDHRGIRVSCQSMNICSKLEESNVDNVSVGSLVQLEEHLENALSVTRARKVRYFREVFSFLTLFFKNNRALIFNYFVADRTNVEACREP